jgi:hypothetical protein
VKLWIETKALRHCGGNITPIRRTPVSRQRFKFR